VPIFIFTVLHNVDCGWLLVLIHSIYTEINDVQYMTDDIQSVLLLTASWANDFPIQYKQ